MVALPAVAVLWLTVGLPMLSQLTSAGASNRFARKVVFTTQAGGAGADASGPQTVAAATVSDQVLAAYRADVARHSRAHARGAPSAKAANLPLPLPLPQPALRGDAPGRATLATVDAPQAPVNPPAGPPADKSAATGNSGGSNGLGDSGGTSDPAGRGTTTPAPDPGSSGDSGTTGDSGTGETGTGDPLGDDGVGGAGAGPGASTPPPPPPPPPAASAPSPPGAPAPADIQTTSGGGPHGKPATGDAIVYTFASAPAPSLILAGWNGTAMSVMLQITDSGTNDFVTILNAATGTQVTALGSVQLGGDYANKQSVFATGSTMTLSGNVVTVVLGTLTGKPREHTKAGTMIWTTPSGTATESGPADNEF